MDAEKRALHAKLHSAGAVRLQYIYDLSVAAEYSIQQCILIYCFTVLLYAGLSKILFSGHAIDAAMLQLGHLSMLKAAKGYHFVDGPYVEYTCSPEFSMSAEELGNLPGQLSAVMREIVAERLETKVEFLSNQEAAELCKSDLAGYPAVVRVVTVAGNPCPCGGTHVENVALLEGIEITKAKIKKKILKISYVLN